MIPYGTQWITEDEISAVLDVLRNGFLTQGPNIKAFEDEIAAYVGAKYCVTFCNATAALQSAVKVLEIPKNMEGITSPNTFVASSNCLAYNDLHPIFADIDSESYNITADSIKQNLSSKTKVLIPVHFAGQPCEMEGIFDLASQKNLHVIEDAAHAIGSKYRDGTPVGNCKYSSMTIFSFHPVKTLTSGEGGAVTTNSEDLYKKLLMMRSHGITKDPAILEENPGPWYYEQHELGYNFRITDLQCALGRVQLSRLDCFKSRRQSIVKTYNKAFKNIKLLTTPKNLFGSDNCLHLYTVQIQFEELGMSRKSFMEKLMANGIGSQVLYIPVHTQPWYKKNYGYKWGDYPNAENYYSKALSLPLFPKMTDHDVNKVILIVKEIFKCKNKL